MKRQNMTIYLDIVFIENVLMNYIILFACVVLLKVKPHKIRLILSSCIGAIYTIIMYLNIVPIYSNFIMKFVLSIVIVYVALKPRKIKVLLKQLTIFYLTSFVFGGCVFALMYFLKPQLVQIRNGSFVGTYPIKVAIVGGSIAFVLIQISFKLIKTKISKNDIIYKTKIHLFQDEIELCALLDTGNLLKEPITGLPVMIVEKEKMKNILPKEILNNIDVIIGGDTSELNYNENLIKYISRFRMIPFSSVGKQNGLLLGIRVDSVDIITNETTEQVQNVIIGVYEQSFTKNGAYSAIFGLDMLEGGNVNENVSSVKV
jgi:stage II sporulation protein GA (sporulation sigma-E factor processing peptidase)